MTHNPPFDTSIPVLTEVFQDQHPDNADNAPPHDRRATDHAPAAETAAHAAPVAPAAQPSAPVSTPAATPASAPAPVASAHDQNQVNAQLEAKAVDSWTEPEWNLMERRLSERILQQLQSRVDFVLEQRLRDSMEDVLKQAMAGLTAEIRQGLQQTIEKIVLRAVSQELTHLQTLKK